MACVLPVTLQAQSGAPAIPSNSGIFPPATFDFNESREPVARLEGLWRFHTGDDPEWAKPAFDDTSWSLVNPAETESGKTASQPHYTGTAWYRARVQIPANSKPLTLEIARTAINYQVFADGKLLGTMGDMPPNAHAHLIPQRAFTLPVHVSNQPQTLALAFRLWNWPGWKGDPTSPTDGLRIGDAKIIDRDMELHNDHAAWGSFSLIILAILDGLAVLAALTLYSIRRGEREYLWFAAFRLASLVEWIVIIYPSTNVLALARYDFVFPLQVVARVLTELAFYYFLLDGRRTWLLWSAIVAGLCPLGEAVAALILVHQSERVPIGLGTAINTLSILPGLIWVVQLVIRRAFRGFPDARLLLFPVLFSKIVGLCSDTLYAIRTSGLYPASSDWIDHTIRHPFDAGLEDIGEAFFLIAILAIFVHRFTRTRLHEEGYEREREAARTVQQVLVPQDNPSIPGFTIQSVYKPHGEVGGDFFQIIPTPNNGVLIAVGDVSGKGMPAAMTVSLLVGLCVHWHTTPSRHRKSSPP